MDFSIRSLFCLLLFVSQPFLIQADDTLITSDSIIDDREMNRLNLMAMFASDAESYFVRTSGYVYVDHGRPLEDRMQILADASFGKERLAVSSIETSGTLKIAHIAMTEEASVTKFADAWWYRHFQGSTGSVLMKRRIQMTFAQNAYPGVWIDVAILTSKFYLGSHAEDLGCAYGVNVIRLGWRWPEELLDKPEVSDQTVSIPVRMRAPGKDRQPKFIEYNSIQVMLARDERLVCTLEVYDPVSCKTLHYYTDSLKRSFIEKINVEPPYTVNEPEFYQQLKEGNQLIMRIYATNCSLPDLYPPVEDGRYLLRPEGFVFREIHRQWIAHRSASPAEQKNTGLVKEDD